MKLIQSIYHIYNAYVYYSSYVFFFIDLDKNNKIVHYKIAVKYYFVYFNI